MKAETPTQRFHPFESSGWTCSVLGNDGKLVARFYGASCATVEELARRYVRSQPGHPRI